MNEEEYKVVDKMEQCGGSFVKHLAILFRLADEENFKELKNAFPEYWERYKKLAKSEEI